ncbi:MAG TPA: CrcB family protein [Dehalococcoidia bacterium]|nr:CrcB family protein [Dehalococcoidia bacterium]
MERIIAIGLAGALGALSRYGLQSLVNEVAGRPSILGTLLANLTGAFVLGLLIAATENRLELNSVTRAAIAVGFLGSYTTFSTFMFESVTRLENGEVLLVLAYVAGSIVLGLALTYAGLQVGRAV